MTRLRSDSIEWRSPVQRRNRHSSSLALARKLLEISAAKLSRRNQASLAVSFLCPLLISCRFCGVNRSRGFVPSLLCMCSIDARSLLSYAGSGCMELFGVPGSLQRMLWEVAFSEKERLKTNLLGMLGQ